MLCKTILTNKFVFRQSLFENIDFGIVGVIESQILESIANYEPRVDNVQVQVNPTPERNSFDVTVLFDIIGQEFPTQEFTFILEATR